MGHVNPYAMSLERNKFGLGYFNINNYFWLKLHADSAKILRYIYWMWFDLKILFAKHAFGNIRYERLTKMFN